MCRRIKLAPFLIPKQIVSGRKLIFGDHLAVSFQGIGTECSQNPVGGRGGNNIPVGKQFRRVRINAGMPVEQNFLVGYADQCHRAA